jgi:hypothetical protein
VPSERCSIEEQSIVYYGGAEGSHKKEKSMRLKRHGIY